MRRMINDGWRFLKAEADSRYEEVRARAAETVCLPNDWAISDPEDFYRDADGWYFKTLDAALKVNENSFKVAGDAQIYMSQKTQLLTDKNNFRASIGLDAKRNNLTLGLGVNALLSSGQKDVAVNATLRWDL